jgi:Transposase IS66 family
MGTDRAHRQRVVISPISGSRRDHRIFTRKTGFVTLDRLLARLHANRGELLIVLDRPEIPLHTNGSENDVRCQVTNRKVSGGTRSDTGRDCRDAFLSLSLRKARHPILGLPRRPPRGAKPPRCPSAAATHQAALRYRLRAPIPAASFLTPEGSATSKPRSALNPTPTTLQILRPTVAPELCAAGVRRSSVSLL